MRSSSSSSSSSEYTVSEEEDRLLNYVKEINEEDETDFRKLKIISLETFEVAEEVSAIYHCMAEHLPGSYEKVTGLPIDLRENEVILFHGTTSERVQSISHNGLMMTYAKEGLWGVGHYFSPSPRMAAKYSSDGTIILCRVLLGNKMGMGETKYRTLRSAPRGYHSVSGIHPKKKAEVAVVYRDAQVLPFATIKIKKKKKKGRPGFRCFNCGKKYATCCNTCHACDG